MVSLVVDPVSWLDLPGVDREVGGSNLSDRVRQTDVRISQLGIRTCFGGE